MNVRIPAELQANPVDFSKLVNRDALQSRDNVYYSELVKSYKEVEQCIKFPTANGSDEYVEKVMEFLALILVNIHQGWINPVAAAGWALQSMNPHIIDDMLNRDEKIKKEREEYAKNMVTKEQAELLKNKKHDLDLRAAHSAPDEEPISMDDSGMPADGKGGDDLEMDAPTPSTPETADDKFEKALDQAASSPTPNEEKDLSI